MEDKNSNRRKLKEFNSGISDIEKVLLLIGYIDNPCVEPITGENIRPFYIRLAKNLLGEKTLKNPYAVKLLEMKIKEYD